MEKIWYEDVVHFLLNPDSMTRFIPDSNHTLVENLNACMRFAIYLTILLLIIKRDQHMLAIMIVVGVITSMVYLYDKSQLASKQELFDKLGLEKDKRSKEVCMRPSPENPFMNVAITDYTDFPNRPRACDITRKSTKRQVADMFNNGLYRDVDDIFNKKASDRQFYTMPNTMIPNNQQAFAEWCFKTGKTCKEDGVKCML